VLNLLDNLAMGRTLLFTVLSERYVIRHFSHSTPYVISLQPLNR